MPDVREFVGGAALQSLDQDGHFTFPPPEAWGSGTVISAIEAVNLTSAFLQTYFVDDVSPLPGSVSFREEVEAVRGEPVDWVAARASAEGTYFSESHLEPIAAELNPAVVRFFGHHYLVPIIAHAEQVVLVSVSAQVDNIVVDNTGRLQVLDPRDQGNEFSFFGIPAVTKDVVPPSPELAVALVAAATAAKVVAVPRLHSPGLRIDVGFSRWALLLDRKVEFVATGSEERYVSDRVDFGLFFASENATGSIWSMRILVPHEEQPSYEVIPNPGGTPDSLDAAIRSDTPVRLVEVVPARCLEQPGVTGC